MERTTKSGRKIVAEVKSYLVITKQELQTGKLDKRGEEGRMFSNVIPKKVIPIGEKVCLRAAVKKFNGNLLIYIHSWGWIEMNENEISEKLQSNKSITADDLISLNYQTLNNEQKIKILNKYVPEKFENLNKTETMLMAYLNGGDLNEIEKQIAADTSLKYKIKKHPEKFENTFIKKLEEAIS